MSSVAAVSIVPDGRLKPVRGNRAFTISALVVSDLVSITIAYAAVLAGFSWLRISIDSALYYGLWPVMGTFLLTNAVLGLYPCAGTSPVEELRRLVVSTSLLHLLVASAICYGASISGYSKAVFLALWLVSTVTVPAGRAALRLSVARRDWWGIPVVVLGARQTERDLVARLNSQPEMGFKPAVCLDDSWRSTQYCHDVPVIGPTTAAPRVARETGIQCAMLSMQSIEKEKRFAALEYYSNIFRHLIVITDLPVSTLGITPRDLGGALGLEVKHNLLIPFNQFLKRLIDLTFGTVMAIFALPIVGVAALWIKKVSPGESPLFTQRREGRGGRQIVIWKLRTMHPSAGELLEAHLAANPAAREEWKRHFKLKKDPRVLPVIGTLLRRSSLDELPQLWNVLRGDMSLVGPRPFPSYHLEQFPAEFRIMRRKVMPGLTGLWQVSARSDADIATQIRLDTFYIQNWSSWMDVYLLAATARSVLMGKGAY